MVSPPDATTNDGREGNNEYTPLLKDIKVDEEVGRRDCEEVVKVPEGCTNGNVGGVISVLLLGVFIANADSSLVIATSGTISSEFDDLENAGWLITSYTLAMCATQSLYGKLSDIYGRKSMILASYVFFSVGCAMCGLGQTLGQVIVGRLIAGVGGAGINCLVAIVIADMVPIREVASWRSYVNVAATTGRSLGGPIGGLLTDTIGWRWSFLGQCPPTLLALALVIWHLSIPCLPTSEQSHVSKLKRVDFLGAVLLSASITTGLLVLDLSSRLTGIDSNILTLFGACLVTGSLFLLVEAFWAKEPIFPLRLLLERDVLTSYVNLGFQSGAQMAMMMLVPMYFQVSAHASATTAGAHLMPSVMGNAVGGILTGIVIRRTGRYKAMAIIGAAASTTTYTLMLLRWHGHTSFFESLYIIGGGFGNGIALSASFIALTADLKPEFVAIASSGLYLSSNIGCVSGLSVAVVVMQTTLRKDLRVSLQGFEGMEDIERRALRDLDFVLGLKGRVGEVVRDVYVRCLAYTHGVSVIGALVALIAAICVREHRL